MRKPQFTQVIAAQIKHLNGTPPLWSPITWDFLFEIYVVPGFVICWIDEFRPF